MRIVPAILIALAASAALAPMAVAARSVVVTYELPAACVGFSCFVANSGDLGFGVWPVGSSVDVGGAIAVMPQSGETTVSATARDASGAPVQAVFCQDVDGNGRCDTQNANPGNPDLVVFMCDGDLPTTTIDPSKAVNVIVPQPRYKFIPCALPQGPTVTGSVTFSFD